MKIMIITILTFFIFGLGAHAQTVFVEKIQKKTTEEMFNLGQMYFNGDGVARDHKKAFYWLKQAAHAKNTKAQYQLGKMYFNGDGIAKDHEKAFYWFKKLAQEGSAKAQAILGVMYFYGNGVTKDYIKSYKWAFLANEYEKNNEEIFINYKKSLGQLLGSLEKKMVNSDIKEAKILVEQFKVLKNFSRDIASEEKPNEELNKELDEELNEESR